MKRLKTPNIFGQFLMRAYKSRKLTEEIRKKFGTLVTYLIFVMPCAIWYHLHIFKKT